MTIGLAAVRVLVVVLTADSGDASTRPMEDALHAALAKDATIIVESLPESTTDDNLKMAAMAENAPLLGVVSWNDRQRRASIRFVKPEDGRWTEREVRFDAVDAPSEKGRTVGFTLASMMPEEAFVPETKATPVAPVVSPPKVVTPAPTPDRAVDASPPLRVNPFALDLTTLGALSAEGYGGGVGGTFAARIPITGALGFRFAGSARFGEIAPAQATSRVFSASAGLTFQPWLDRSHRWAVGLRADGMLIVHQVSHLSDDDLEAKLLTRALPGLDGALEGAYWFANRAAVVGALGGELALGSTDIYVRQRRVAELTALRGLAEAGVRVAF